MGKVMETVTFGGTMHGEIHRVTVSIKAAEDWDSADKRIQESFAVMMWETLSMGHTVLGGHRVYVEWRR